MPPTHHTTPDATSIRSLAYPHMWVSAASHVEMLRQDHTLATRIAADAETSFAADVRRWQAHTGIARAANRGCVQANLPALRRAMKNKEAARSRLFARLLRDQAERDMMQVAA